jgi:hypothetical protein
MGRIGRRLDNLERLAESRSADEGGSPRYLEAYFRALENLDREKAGLPPLPIAKQTGRTMRSFCERHSPFSGRAWDGKGRRRKVS